MTDVTVQWGMGIETPCLTPLAATIACTWIFNGIDKTDPRVADMCQRVEQLSVTLADEERQRRLEG